jgi:hypothetical protein
MFDKTVDRENEVWIVALEFKTWMNMTIAETKEFAHNVFTEFNGLLCIWVWVNDSDMEPIMDNEHPFYKKVKAVYEYETRHRRGVKIILLPHWRQADESPTEYETDAYLLSSY